MATKTRKRTVTRRRTPAEKPIEPTQEQIVESIDQQDQPKQETAPETTGAQKPPEPAPRTRQTADRWRDPERNRHRRAMHGTTKLDAPLWAKEMAEAHNLTLRFVNDTNGTGQRVKEYEAAGWQLVEAPEGMERDPGWTSALESGADSALVSRIVNSNGERAYLMAKPKEWYEEDQQAKTDRIKRAEEPILRGTSMPNSYGETTVKT